VGLTSEEQEIDEAVCGSAGEQRRAPKFPAAVVDEWRWQSPMGIAWDCELTQDALGFCVAVLSCGPFFFLLQKAEAHTSHGAHHGAARAGEPTAEQLGNPPSLNISHWGARGPHTDPVDQRRVLVGSALLIGAAFVLFNLMRLSRGDAPKTVGRDSCSVWFVLLTVCVFSCPRSGRLLRPSAIAIAR
jgi:hypothetical protein